MLYTNNTEDNIFSNYLFNKSNFIGWHTKEVIYTGIKYES